MKSILLTAALSLFLAGCNTVPDHNSAPESLAYELKPMGVSNIRSWGNQAEFSYDYLETLQDNYLARHEKPTKLQVLALSGGGANGAFGAGILTAWTKTGTRPEFDMVTGVSTGAILAIFAFIGSDYDEHVVDFYTNYGYEDLFKAKGLLTSLRSMAILNISPYETLVRETITPQLLSKVAEGFHHSRLLLIGTTHLESQRLSIWNMGAIAAQNTPQSEKLFEDIILASTAIPGAMPAVQIDMEYGNETYQELHVDGGVARQVFFLPDTLSAHSFKEGVLAQERSLYVIRNGEFLPQWQEVTPSLVEVSSRSLNTIIKYQGRSDVMRIFGQANQANIEFNFAHIGNDFTDINKSQEQFNPEHMKKLFNYGHLKMIEGDLWLKRPPEFDSLILKVTAKKK
ncbi:patatin-like phospholipase family protein [Shewanella kaireitica]|uniref:patatin-like phospholipase family protein n=1 Tax=Shewanella kaireitica TaxID=212021 RepID=UPI00200C05EC|nr:patatin-like phospholipase family protein [Shewanella kaireitica]MCL1093453.1 patatin-like phospholipase family protein [Shewanella kaireitica]